MFVIVTLSKCNASFIDQMCTIYKLEKILK